MIANCNCKRFAITAIAGFIFTCAYDFIVHGKLLKPMYDATANIWRPEESMEQFFPFCMAVSFLTVSSLLYIFTRNYEGKGVGEGIRFGTMMGVLIGLLQFSLYAYLPISLNLAIAWFVCAFLWSTALGAIFSLLYKNK